ncbi:hypothetical protein [Blastococcus sp. SYSU D00813]
MTGPLAPLAPVLGRWRSSGIVLDDGGGVTQRISGTDVYGVLPGGRWIAHDVDVDMGGQRVLAHELIGGAHPAGGWWMYAFDEAAAPGVMRLTREEPGLLLLHGDGVRSWFRTGDGGDVMTTRWEREADGGWRPWMDMRFERLAPGT